MRTIAPLLPLFLLGYYIAIVSCEGYSQDYGNNLYDELNGGSAGLDLEELYNKRNNERYAFGLGRRAYTYTTGKDEKRIPVYNFGLGKRATPYSFGLGKRHPAEESKFATWRMIPMFSENTVQEPQIPISSNLKRGRDDEQVDRRSSSSRYNFGLGKR